MNSATTPTMQAAVVEAFGQPLVLRAWPRPAPQAGEILVKTEACGVCHTDLHAARGDWPLKPRLSFIPGHEGIGRVVALAANGRVVAGFELQPLTAINDVFKRLAAGQVASRLVLDFA